MCRDKARASDRVLEKEKDKPVGQVFNASFSWTEMIDAIAAVYLGVSCLFIRCIARNIDESDSSHSGASSHPLAS